MRVITLLILLLNACHTLSGLPQPAPHPRLFLLDSELPLVHEAIAQDTISASWYSRLLQQADQYVADNSTVVWSPGRILTQSRHVLWKVTTLAEICFDLVNLYRLNGNATYAQTAIQEMLAAAAFPGWDPVAFLDTSEMINALAIGHDWLYDVISTEDKQTITKAIYEKGFHYGMEYYNGNWTEDPSLVGGLDWSTVDFNWNQVCNGGLLVGAISLWEVYPDVTQKVILTLQTGGWAEGPMYWQYGTNYLSYGIGAMLSAFGTDFGLVEKFPGVALTGNFRIHTLSPAYNLDDYADCEFSGEYAWCMIFLGRLFNNSLYLSHERMIASVNGLDTPMIFHLFYSRAQDSNLSFSTSTPLSDYFRSVEVVTFRTTWEMGNNTDYIYGAIKVNAGGDTTQNHQDLDLGHFIIEKNGQRFVLDLGDDNYSLPGYFSVPERYQYYRTNTSGHNVLMFNGNWNQMITQAKVTNYTSTESEVYVEVDLSQAYITNATSVLRSMLFDRLNNFITISDQITTNSNTRSVAWRFQTQADVSVNGNQVLLSMGGQTLTAKLITPTDIPWTVYPYNLAPPFDPAPNLHVVQLDLPLSNVINVAVQFE